MRYTISVLMLSWAVAASAQPNSNNELVVNLYNQLQELQNEVLTLRGLVEEQGYQLQRLQNDSRDRYLDLDRRLQGLSAGGDPAAAGTPAPLNAPATAGAAPLNAPGGVANATPSAGNAPAQPPLNNGPVPLSELNNASTPPNAAAAQQDFSALDDEETYRTALNLLLEENKPAQAIAAFQSYITRFPTGRRFTNALYWQGEAFILEQRNQEALDVFSRLLNEYPQDAKAPGAMLKSGVAYSQMGDRRAAENLWRELSQRYPNASAEIAAAQNYLRR